jgi:hypothetical protein
MSIPITESTLKAFGFKYEHLNGCSPYEWYERDGLHVWDLNGLFWLVNELDQGGLDVEFHTMNQLHDFWLAVGKPPILT